MRYQRLRYTVCIGFGLSYANALVLVLLEGIFFILLTVLPLAVMPFTYNISYGIAFGLISYIVISVFCGDFKKIKVSSRIIAALFVAMLLLTH